jgi:hypothetical protein
MYVPTMRREQAVTADSFKLARELAEWKLKTPMRFSSLKVLDFTIDGVQGDTIDVGQPLVVKARIDPGKMDEKEIIVELMIGRAEGSDFIESPASVPLEIAARGSDGILTFSGQYEVSQNGLYSYGIRVAPYHNNLATKYDLGLMLWG